MTKTNRIEALLDAIGKLNGIHNPESVAYKLHNPLKLKSFAILGKHDVDAETGLRKFGSFQAGYKGGFFDLELKMKGLSRAGLQSSDPLKNLLGCYSILEKQAVDSVVSFVRRALDCQTISTTTPLSFFTTDDDAK